MDKRPVLLQLGAICEFVPPSLHVEFPTSSVHFSPLDRRLGHPSDRHIVHHTEYTLQSNLSIEQVIEGTFVCQQ